MAGYIENFLTKHCILCKVGAEQGGSSFYAIFRILTGLLFIQHGFQKIFGSFGGVDGAGTPVEVFTIFGAAGLLELIIGAVLVLGIYTRLAALIGAMEMVVAYFMVHLPLGFFPVVNQGELALLFLAAFLAMIRYGSGRWSLEKAITKKELF